MTWRVRVTVKPGYTDHTGEAVCREWSLSVGKGVRRVRAGQVYELSGEVDRPATERLAARLLADPVTQDAVVFAADQASACRDGLRADIWLKTGVADPVADTVRLAAADLGVAVAGVRSGTGYEFIGSVAADAVKTFCEEHLMNTLIQSVEIL